ncbi:unnamed protein product [Caenorhabditis auriculariae]|uniref:Uncharacterized protein n=1 Tax=Caenorhabditis auriculariae TaxID=2777116 RepID=A0A8S1GPC5_9PELO|nr:unnamed protein product [Caenorhabditis auriculariae]
MHDESNHNRNQYVVNRFKQLFLQSKISLISKLDIRYEGILYTVDTNDSTIALAKVRSFGTEKRPTANPVAARDDVYEYIIFKASDIKDLIVCDTPKMATLSGGLPYDPAIISVSSRTAPANSDGSQPGHPSAGSSRSDTPNRQSPLANIVNRAPGSGRGGFSRGRGGFISQSDNRQQGRQFVNYNRGGGFNARGRNNFGVPRVNTREKLKFDSDFDFEKANEHFQEVLCDNVEKLKLEGEEKQEVEENDEDKQHFYDKKTSFFDNISCEALEKAEGKTGRPDWRKERETNQETFGHSAVRSLNYRRGFGQRGRGGNRGYGGYNNYNRGGSYNGYNNYRNNFNRNQGGLNKREQNPSGSNAEPQAQPQ